MKLRRLSNAVIGAVLFSSTTVSTFAQTPSMPPPPPSGTNTMPQQQSAPPPPQNLHMQFPTMPPAPPSVAPVNVNTPGIEANLPSKIDVPGVIAVVNGVPITYNQLIKQFLSAGAPQFLDEVINEHLIRQQAAKQGVVVTPAETTTKLNEFKNAILPQYPGMSWAQFLALQGRSESYIRDNIYDGLLAVKLVEKNTPGDSIIGRVHLYHILRLTQSYPNGPVASTDAQAKAEIDQIQADIQSGKVTFQQEAMKESQDSTAAQGGDLGWVGPTDGLDKAFAAAAFALKEGEVSQPVRSQFGWHLIYAAKLGIHATPAEVAAYEQTKEQRARQQIQVYLKNLRAQAKVINYSLQSPVPVISPTAKPALSTHTISKSAKPVKTVKVKTTS